jgi:hypothetical protein
MRRFTGSINPNQSSTFNAEKRRREQRRAQEQERRREHEASDSDVNPIGPLAGFLKKRGQPCQNKNKR